MAKESGLGWSTASVDDSGGSLRAIVNDILSLDFSTPRGTGDSTGLDKSAMERLLLLGDQQTTISGNFNDASNTSHDVFKTVASADVTRSQALTISGQSLNTEVLLLDYALARSATGEFTYTVPTSLQDGTDPTWT